MCFVFKCTNCGKPEMYTYSEATTVDKEEFAARLLRLASEPVSKYHNWCADCIVDAPKT